MTCNKYQTSYDGSFLYPWLCSVSRQCVFFFHFFHVAKFFSDPALLAAAHVLLHCISPCAKLLPRLTIYTQASLIWLPGVPRNDFEIVWMYHNGATVIENVTSVQDISKCCSRSGWEVWVIVKNDSNMVWMYYNCAGVNDSDSVTNVQDILECFRGGHTKRVICYT